MSETRKCVRCGEPILPEHEEAITPDGPIHYRGGCNGKSGKMFGREARRPDYSIVHAITAPEPPEDA